MAGDERCERTDLLKRDCAHCRPASNIDVPHHRHIRRSRNGFPARYPSTCCECHDSIDAGEYIVSVYEDDERVGYAHEGCEAS
jgi:hypothetical protein